MHSIPNKERKELRQPMVVVALFVVVGLYIGWLTEFNSLIIIGLTVVVGALYYLFRTWWLLLLLMMGFGIGTTTVWRNGGENLRDENQELSVSIISHNRAYIDSFRDNGRWCPTRQLLYYGSDSTLNLVAGDRLITRDRVWEFAGGKYLRLTQRNSQFESTHSQWMWQLNKMACSKIDRLNLSPHTAAVVKSMLLGRRETMDDNLVRNYNRSGVAHVLAISGLHMAIIYMIFTMLLRPLNILPYGHITRHIVVILLLWGYAMVVGMGASVVRAALMLTMLKGAHILHREYSSTAALIITIMTMSLLTPSTLLEVGFWLSVIAVYSIVVWGVPIMRQIERWSYHKEWGTAIGFMVNSSLSMLLISAICTVALLPLLSHTFGYVSLWGVVATPLILLTTYLILISSLLWLLFGFGWMEIIFSSFIESITLIQNQIIKTISDSSSGMQHFSLERWEMFAIYALYLIIVLLSRGQYLRKS